MCLCIEFTQYTEGNEGVFGRTQYHGQCIVPDMAGALNNSYSGSTRYGGERGTYNTGGSQTRDGRATRESKYNKAAPKGQPNAAIKAGRNVDAPNKNLSNSNAPSSPDKSTPTVGGEGRRSRRGNSARGLHLTNQSSEGKRNSVQR